MSFLNNPIHALIDYIIWTRKSKPGKQAGDPSWEAAKPSKKVTVSFAGPNTSSFKNAKSQIFRARSDTVRKPRREVTATRFLIFDFSIFNF
jgi:hypothetical protein